MRLGAAVLIAIIILGGSQDYFVVEAGRSGHRARSTAYIVSLSKPVRLGRLEQKTLRESSGIIASKRYPGVYWSINDSGNPPDLLAIKVDGKGISRIRVSRARNIDWEDLAADTKGAIYIGDFGNNARRRRVLSIFCVDEPNPYAAKKTVKVKTRVRFSYPAGQGPFDCEAMFVRKGWAYLITKEPLSAGLWRVRLEGKKKGPCQARYLGELPRAQWVTAADISPDGKWIAVLSYFDLFVYQLPRPIDKMLDDNEACTTTRSSSQASRPFSLIFKDAKLVQRSISLRQAEGVCWELSPEDKRPRALIITNEQRGIYRVRLVLSKDGK